MWALESNYPSFRFYDMQKISFILQVLTYEDKTIIITIFIIQLSTGWLQEQVLTMVLGSWSMLGKH